MSPRCPTICLLIITYLSLSSSSSTSVPAECENALDLTEGWRQDHKGSRILPRNNWYNSDTEDMIESGRPWFRFSGDAGNKLLNECVPRLSCGSLGALWSDDNMPTVVGVVTPINVYGKWGDDCRAPWYTKNMSVVRCSTSPHDYVYRYDGDRSRWLGFCGMTGL